MIRFGTGGWRAIIGDEFTKANIQRLAKAIAMKMQAEGVAKEGLVIGYDRRFLSKETVYWSCEVLAKEGIPVWFVNRSVPTPLVMFYVKEHRLPYGMMVTASHNPSLYNGIKVFTRGGRDATEEHTKELEQYVLQIEEEHLLVETMEYEEALEAGLVQEIYPLNEYVDCILANINMEAIRNANLHVVLDPMYGVSQSALKMILMTARCELDVIHENHDTLFGRRLPAPMHDTLRELEAYVAEYHCHLGLATDGDADRLGVVDNAGRFLHPNEILVLLYYYLLKYKGWTGPVVRNIGTTHVLDRVAAYFGEECYEVPVGFKYISEKMEETNALIGGESSGGLTVRGHIHGKDGVYAAALLVEMVAVTKKTLSQLQEEIETIFGVMYMEERSYRMTDSERMRRKKIVFEEKKLPDMPFPVEHISYMGGCKVFFRDDRWILVRFSGTEPVMRIFCEMHSQEEANILYDIFEHFFDLTKKNRLY